jgi:hypothetical protein
MSEWQPYAASCGLSIPLPVVMITNLWSLFDTILNHDVDMRCSLIGVRGKGGADALVAVPPAFSCHSARGTHTADTLMIIVEVLTRSMLRKFGSYTACTSAIMRKGASIT